MKNSTLFLICMAFLATIVALASYASAQCAACQKEGDWSQSASNFIDGKPTSDVPAEFGPKAVRKTASQLENKTKAAEVTTDNDANAAASSEAQSPTAKLGRVLESLKRHPECHQFSDGPDVINQSFSHRGSPLHPSLVTLIYL